MCTNRSLPKVPRLLLRRLGLSFVLLFLTFCSWAHTIELRAKLNPDGSATFYARTYHGMGELPSGGFIVDGVIYPFQGVIGAPALPAGSILISTCSYNFSNRDNYQWVTVPNFNSCIAHNFNCTSNAPEQPLCNLSNTLNLGGPQVTLQPALANGAACIGSSGIVQVGASGSNLIYQWQIDTGSGFVNVTDDAMYSGATTPSLAISLVTPAMSSHVFRAVVSGTDACGNTSSATSNSVPLNPGTAPAISTQPLNTTACVGANTSFSITATGTDLMYQWQISTNNGGTWSNIANEMASVLPLTSITAAQSGQQYRVIINSPCGITLTSNAATLTALQPRPGFTLNDASQCLKNNSFLFMNHSSIDGGATLTYAWTFGDGSVSTAINPVHRYTAAGTYAVHLTITGNNGCSDSVAQDITIAPMPDAGFTVNKTAQCMTAHQFQFTNTSAIADENALAYSWDFGDGTTSTEASPAKTYAQPGYYKVILTAGSESGCTDTAMVFVRVVADAAGTIITPQTSVICEGSDMALRATGGNTYQWYLNDSAITDATAATFAAKEAGRYSVALLNEFGCSSMSANAITLTKVMKPTAAFTYAKSCENVPVHFTNTMENKTGVQYNWNFGDNAESALRQGSHTYAQAGTYTVQLVATPTGCPLLADTVQQVLTITKPVTGMRLPTINAVANQSVSLQARTLDAQYQWRPATGLSNPTAKITDAKLQQETTFFIDMETAAGCVTTDTLLVRIFRNNDVFIPSGFTPDGDGRNDLFRVTLVEARQLRFLRIYNRRGNIIFETSNPATGWDGTWKGARQPADTYLWTCEAVGADGTVIRKSGSVTLIR